MASTLHARFESSEFLPVGTPKFPCAAPVDSEEALQHRIVDACQTIRIYPGIFAWMRQSMVRHVEACIEFYGDILSTYYKCTRSTINHKLNVSEQMLIWTIFLVLMCEIRVDILTAPFSYTLLYGQAEMPIFLLKYDIPSSVLNYS
jgi:hypothetical protein